MQVLKGKMSVSNGKITVWDSLVTGLHTITNGSKTSWYVYYRLRSGKQRRSKIGSVNVITLKQARDIAKEILAKVALGQDPFEEGKRTKHVRVHDSFVQLFLDHYSQERFMVSGHRKDVLYLYEKHIEKRFGKKEVSKVTSKEIKEWHSEFRNTPILGNRAKAVLSKIFSFADSNGHVPPGFNPAGSVPNFQERSRKRYATEEEIEKIVSVLDRLSISNPLGAVFIKILLLTGSRISALERVTWADIKRYENGAVINVRGKTGVDEIILSPTAWALVEKLPKDNLFVFGKFPRVLWRRVKEMTHIEGLWARDLRRTFGTVGLSSGVSRGAISELLNHKSEQTTKIYSLLIPKAKMQAAKTISEEIERLIQ